MSVDGKHFAGRFFCHENRLSLKGDCGAADASSAVAEGDAGATASAAERTSLYKTPSEKASFSVYNLRIVPKYSIVVPLHNEQENVTDLYDRLKVVMEAAGETFEIVLVDDGSSDRTFATLR